MPHHLMNLRHVPDDEADEMFKAITEAFELLSDPKRLAPVWVLLWRVRCDSTSSGGC